MKAYAADAKLIILLVLSHVASQHVSAPFRRLSQRTPTKWLPPFRQLPNRGHGQSGKRSRTVFICERRRMFNTSLELNFKQKHSLHIIRMSIPMCSPIPCSFSHNSSMSIIIIIPVIAATQGIQHKEPKPVLPSYLESCFFYVRQVIPKWPNYSGERNI